MGLSTQQATHRLMREALGSDLRDAVEAGSLDGGEASSIRCRACAVLYMLLCDHLVDRRGRCRLCRRTGAMFGRRRRKCRIYLQASLWLRQPGEVVLGHLARELNHRPAPVQRAGGRPDRRITIRATPAGDP